MTKAAPGCLVLGDPVHTRHPDRDLDHARLWDRSSAPDFSSSRDRDRSPVRGWLQYLHGGVSGILLAQRFRDDGEASHG